MKYKGIETDKMAVLTLMESVFEEIEPLEED